MTVILSDIGKLPLPFAAARELIKERYYDSKLLSRDGKRKGYEEFGVRIHDDYCYLIVTYLY